MSVHNDRLYYAHAKPIYETSLERMELEQIRSKFGDHAIVNPAEYEGNPEKRKDVMKFCFRLIDPCSTIVFSKWSGEITCGVGAEVNYALEKGKIVYELVEGKFLPVKDRVSHLSFEETIRRYYSPPWK